ncbi:Uncharacterised protein [Bordetella pertussis]|nr:Uncharacterised protein [Bordetella pertussis]CFT95706.1 Uncharacterised protein [Bordetella pertussis]
MPSTISSQRALPSRPRTASSSSASVPPSPRLSARSTSVTYLSDTTIMSSQNRMESTPSTWAGCRSSMVFRQARKVYSGLVPISPYTTPNAPSINAMRDDGAWMAVLASRGAPAAVWVMMLVLVG